MSITGVPLRCVLKIDNVRAHIEHKRSTNIQLNDVDRFLWDVLFGSGCNQTHILYDLLALSDYVYQHDLCYDGTIISVRQRRYPHTEWDDSRFGREVVHAPYLNVDVSVVAGSEADLKCTLLEIPNLERKMLEKVASFRTEIANRIRMFPPEKVPSASTLLARIDAFLQE